MGWPIALRDVADGRSMNPWIFVAVTAVAAVAMEPISAGIHRWFGHGPGWALHRSHHEDELVGFEANDVIPVVSALLTMLAFWVGVTVPGAGLAVPLALGATIYGMAYFVLHDLYIHRRLPLLPERVEWLEPIRQAHLDHHRTGTDNWGILAGLRARG